MKWLTPRCLNLGLFLGLPLVSVAMIAGCAKDEPAPAADKPTYFQDQRLSRTATVSAIDQNTRMVTLREEDGHTSRIKVDQEVRNLDQVKVGDRVAVDYYESVAIEVLPPGVAVNEIRTDVDRAAKGEQPGATSVQRTTLTGIVEGVDKKAKQVKVRGPAGNLRTITVSDEKKLENVHVGDRVQITYSETLAVGIKPLPPAAPAPAKP